MSAVIWLLPDLQEELINHHVSQTAIESLSSQASKPAQEAEGEAALKTPGSQEKIHDGRALSLACFGIPYNQKYAIHYRELWVAVYRILEPRSQGKNTTPYSFYPNAIETMFSL